MTKDLLALFQVRVHFLDQGIHPWAAVVAGHIIVQVFPDTFDAIVIGAVRRQEMEFYLALRGGNLRVHSSSEIPQATKSRAVFWQRGKAAAKKLILTCRFFGISALEWTHRF